MGFGVFWGVFLRVFWGVVGFFELCPFDGDSLCLFFRFLGIFGGFFFIFWSFFVIFGVPWEFRGSGARAEGAWPQTTPTPFQPMGTQRFPAASQSVRGSCCQATKAAPRADTAVGVATPTSPKTTNQ